MSTPTPTSKKEAAYLRDSSAKETRETYRKIMEEALNKQRQREQGQEQEK